MQKPTTIQLDESVCSRLALYAAQHGLGSWAEAIEHMLAKCEGNAAPVRAIAHPAPAPYYRKLEVVYHPAGEMACQAAIVKAKEATVRLHYANGHTEDRHWNAYKFTGNSNLRVNLNTGYLRHWREKGIVKAEIFAGSGQVATEASGSEIGASVFTNPRVPFGQLQPLVKGLMRTVLEVHPGLLAESDFRNMMDSKLCEGELGLQLGGFSLLRRVKEGKMQGRHQRYWSKVYGGGFYVTNNWWSAYHIENARALARFVEGLINRRPGHPAVPELERHKAALDRYAG